MNSKGSERREWHVGRMVLAVVMVALAAGLVALFLSGPAPTATDPVPVASNLADETAVKIAETSPPAAIPKTATVEEPLATSTEPLQEAPALPSVSGHVYDRVTDRALAGAVVNVHSHATDAVVAIATTDGQGNYAAWDLPPGVYTLTLGELAGYPATRGGQINRIIEIGQRAGQPAQADFGLAQSGTLQGVIAVNGTPVPNMTVVLDSQPRLELKSITSDSQGRFRIEGLGNYTGSLRARGRVSGTLRATPYVAANIEPGQVATTEFDFLEGTASIEGDVLLHRQDGEIVPVSGKVVVTYAYADGDDYNVENMDLPTDREGHYFVEGLWGGRVTVGLYPSIGGVHRHRYTFELGDGERARQDFHFYETRINVKILRMPQDKELDVWLVAIPGHIETIEGTRAEQRDFVESQQRAVGGVRPDGNGGGSGSLGGLPPGDYTIMAAAILGSHTLINHAAGEEFYRRRQTVRTYATLPEGEREIAVELSFPEAP